MPHLILLLLRHVESRLSWPRDLALLLGASLSFVPWARGLVSFLLNHLSDPQMSSSSDVAALRHHITVSSQAHQRQSASRC